MGKRDDELSMSMDGAPGGDTEAEEALRDAGIHYVWGPIAPGSLKGIHQSILLKHYLGTRAKEGGDTGPVQLMINSPGGDVDETNALIDLLGNVSFRVGTCGFGTCASAAACLLAAGTKGLRTVAPNAGIMIHVYSWGTEGNHHDLLAHRKAQDAEYEKEVAFWMSHSKYKTRRQVERYLLKKEDVWLTPKEALQHGIVDHIGSVLR